MSDRPLVRSDFDALEREIRALPEAPRPLRQPAPPSHPGRGLADRVRAWVHTAACWVVVWTAPTDERARF